MILGVLSVQLHDLVFLPQVRLTPPDGDWNDRNCLALDKVMIRLSTMVCHGGLYEGSWQTRLAINELDAPFFSRLSPQKR